MADYGIICYNKAGQVMFNSVTNAALGIKNLTVSASGSITDDLLLQGTPWYSWELYSLMTPRPITISISGNTLTYTLPTAGLTFRQIAAQVIIRYGVK